MSIKIMTSDYQQSDKIFDLCAFHFPCSDGVVAASIIKETCGDPNMVTLPQNYNNSGSSVHLFAGKRAIIVDFSYPPETLRKICDVAEYVVLLDHHKSAEESLRGFSHPKCHIVFDMERCGAQLAWDYARAHRKIYLPNYWNEGFKLYERHWLVETVADRDLWIWRNPDSRAILKGIERKVGFDSVRKIGELWSLFEEKHMEDFLKIGKPICEEEDRLVEMCSRGMERFMTNWVHPDTKERGEFKAVACSPPWHVRSEVADAMLKKDATAEVAVCFKYVFRDDKFMLSIRSRKENGVDLSKWAAVFAVGGGHAQAIGATIYGFCARVPNGVRTGETMNTYFK